MRPHNIAEALELGELPVYFVDAAGVDLTAVRLEPGMLLPRLGPIVAVRPGTELPPWETVRRLLEADPWP